MPLLEDDGADLARLDLASATPEDIGVFKRDTDIGEMLVNRGFVGQHGILVGAVNDTHDVHIGKAVTTFTPVGMGHDRMTSDFSARAFLHAFWHLPVKQSIEAGDADAGGAGFDMLKEGGEASDDAFLVELPGDFAEALQRNTSIPGAARPWFGADFFRRKIAFEVKQHIPFFRIEVSDVGGHHDGGHVGLFTGLHGLAADVANAEGKDAVRLHGVVILGTDEALQHVTVVIDGAVLGNFQRGPKAEVAAADFAVGGAQHDMSAERVLLEEKFKGGFKLFSWHLPGHQRTFSKLVRQQGLAHAADHTSGQHGTDALNNGFKRQPALLGNELKGMLVESFHTVLAHRENAGVGFFGVFGRYRSLGGGHVQVGIRKHGERITQCEWRLLAACPRMTRGAERMTISEGFKGSPIGGCAFTSGHQFHQWNHWFIQPIAAASAVKTRISSKYRPRRRLR